MRRFGGLLTGALLLLTLPGVSSAEPTRITVRVLSKDAKFMGTSIGGVRVVLRDAETGDRLAEGLTGGSTGDTARIMREDRQRGRSLSTEGSASYTAVLDLDEPRKIEVTAYGPVGQPQASNTVSATQWVVPGRHIDQGDAWMLVMPGLCVDVLAPAALARFKGLPAEVKVEANLVMM